MSLCLYHTSVLRVPRPTSKQERSTSSTCKHRVGDSNIQHSTSHSNQLNCNNYSLYMYTHARAHTQLSQYSYGLDGRGSNLNSGKIFLFSTASRQALGPNQPSIQWVPGSSSLGVKRQGREADHLSPSSDEIKNGGAIPPLPHTSLWHSA
jgi:hypothetical protein